MSDDITDAPCTRCGKPVHLPHDPPQPCGTVLCPDHDPCACDECRAATLPPYHVACPRCGEATPEVLLCIHRDRGALCGSCCPKAHPARCPECNGHRERVVGRDRYGYPVGETCGRCAGTGQVNVA